MQHHRTFRCPAQQGTHRPARPRREGLRQEVVGPVSSASASSYSPRLAVSIKIRCPVARLAEILETR